MNIETWNITGSAFHFGRHGLGQEATMVTLPSDSLFAALVSCLARLEGAPAVERFMQPFLSGTPPFVLSSTFPRAGDVHFYPAPTKHVAGKTRVSQKDVKRVAFISEGLFRRLLAGEALADLFAGVQVLQDGQVLVSSDENKSLPRSLSQDSLWCIEQRPRVTLGRAAQNANLFFTGRVVFGEGCGLWFGVRWLVEDPAQRAQLANLLADLEAAGLGAERSTGFGQCKILPGPMMELPSPEGGSWLSLSRYLPSKDETGVLLWPGSAYRLVSFSGWVDSPGRTGQRRRQLTMLQEGAVLGPAQTPAPGVVADVRPRYPTDPDPLLHPVYRSGIAMGVGWTGDPR